MGKNFNIGLHMQNLQTNSLIPAMLIGSTNLSHSISLLITLTLSGSDKVSRSETCWLVHFSTDQNEIQCGIEVNQFVHVGTAFQ